MNKEQIKTIGRIVFLSLFALPIVIYNVSRLTWHKKGIYLVEGLTVVQGIAIITFMGKSIFTLIYLFLWFIFTWAGCVVLEGDLE